MKTIKIIPIIVLLLGLVLVSPVWAKSENANQGNGQQNQAQNGQGAQANEVSNKGQINAAEHRSVVSTFVQKLLDVADRQKGIGEQVRIIAQEQNQGATTTVQAMERVQTRNKIKAFLIGSDYPNLGTLRREVSHTQNRLEQLNRLMESVKNAADKTELQNQIQTMEQERTRIENFVKAQEGKFSLFGWLVKIFDK